MNIVSMFSVQDFDSPKNLLDMRYELIGQLGSGSFAIVWEAFDISLKRHVAIKILHAHRENDQTTQRFFAEAQITANLNHPNIVRIHSHGQEKCGAKRFFIVYELLDAVTLKEWSDFMNPDCGSIAKLLTSIADALCHVHHCRIIHRDIKPENILIDISGRAYLTDFGLALEEGISRTTENVAVGTVAYMSPEQVKCSSYIIDERTDIYSLGVVFYELLTGRLPYTANDIGGYVSKIIEHVPEKPSTCCPSVPKDISILCEKCVEKEPIARIQSAEQLRDELRRFLDGFPIHAKRATTFEHMHKWFIRNPNAAIIATASVIVLTTTLIIVIWLASKFNIERKRADANSMAFVNALITTSLSARSENIPVILDGLSAISVESWPMVRDRLRVETEGSDRTRALRALFALARLGETNEGELISMIEDGTASGEGDNLVEAFSNSPDISNVIKQMKRKSAATNDMRLKSRLAIVTMFLNDCTLALELTDWKNDPIQANDFIFGFEQWHGDLKKIAPFLDSKSNNDLKYCLLASLSTLNREDLSDDLGSILNDAIVETINTCDDNGCIEMAKYVLRNWRFPIPKPYAYQCTNQMYLKTQEMFLNRIQQRQPGGNERLFVSTTEITEKLFQTFVLRSDYSPTYSERPKYDRLAPASWVTFRDIAHFCNWLSKTNGKPQAYSLIDAENPNDPQSWVVNFESTGFRIPRISEWLSACDASPASDYAFGNEVEFLNRFSFYMSNAGANLMPMPCGRLLPDRSGLYDMHGNIGEICHEAPDSLCWAGGSFLSTPNQCKTNQYFSLKIPAGPTLGFRVVCVEETDDQNRSSR